MQYFIRVLQILNRDLIILTDTVQRGADDVDCHARTAAEHDLEIFLVHFQNRAICKSAHCSRARHVLNQCHFTDQIPFACNTQNSFTIMFANILANGGDTVCDDVEDFLVCAFMT